MTKVTVMWGTKKLEVECHADKPVGDFMLTLQKLTGVPVERQKLMMRRKQLKPTDAFEANSIKASTKFMLIGTAELPPEPVEVVESDDDKTLEEDENEGFTEAQKKKIFQGLPNHANNCYLNATLQSLRALPQCEQMIETAVVPATTVDGQVEQAIATLFRDFPNSFTTAFAALKKANPTLFAAVDEQGIPKQQDASESFFYILNCLINALGEPFRRLFNIDMHISSKCAETGKTKESDESTINIPVYVNQDTRQIEQGIVLDQDSELKDEELGRNVLWHDHKTISSLPQYLVFHIQRFEFKKDENITAKILRRIIHPFRIDMLPWLSNDLRSKVANDRESGNSNSGFYTLKVVLTHRGRSASSGHYITHCKYGDTWIRYDDTKATDIEDTDVEALSGSGDWHCSLLLIYEKMSQE
ncbi:hypothetical protein M9Y10_041327 [Tritrichomonas musculus]|uniref:ubiquitinyl hydrolase 1 n=1 Tax=Tritrichomonas musculus TaxID=1915356 RepID=A0ABR2K407_9EUKA